MKKSIPVMAAVMTPFPWHIPHDAPLSQAQAMMDEHHVRHLPVMVDGYVDTVVSVRDLKRARPFGQPLSDEEWRVADVAAMRAYIADVGDPLDRILDVMAETHIGSVIVTKDGELAGIFTENDACRLFAQELREAAGEPPEDDVA